MHIIYEETAVKKDMTDEEINKLSESLPSRNFNKKKFRRLEREVRIGMLDNFFIMKNIGY